MSGGKKSVSKRPKSEAIKIEGFTPPIISQELFDGVQDCLKVRQPKVTKTGRRYLVTGFSNCSLCSSAVVGASANEPYRYYRCNGTFKTALGRGICRAGSISADGLEDVVWRRVCDAIQNPAVLVAELKSHFETGGGNIGQAMSDLKKEIQALKAQQGRLIELRQKDMVDQEILEGQLAPLKALYDEKQQALRVLEVQLEQRDDVAEMERRVLEMCNSVPKTLDEMDFESKRATLAAFGVKLSVTRDDLLIRLVVGPEFTPISHAFPRRSTKGNSSELRGFPRVRRPVVPAFAGTSLTAIRDPCLRRNDGHFDIEQLPQRLCSCQAKISCTATCQPGTTSPPSRVSCSVRITGDWPGSRRVAVRLRGFTNTTMADPAASQSATFSSTSAKRSLGEMTSTARSGAPGK